MADIIEIVDVQIDIKDQVVTQIGFGIPMVLGTFKIFNERARIYEDLQSMTTDGFSDTDPEYQAASAIFSQNPRPEHIVIGRRSVDSATIEITDVTDNENYTTTINGTAFTFNSGESATAETIVTGLVGEINGGNEPVTAIDNEDGTYTINADVSDMAWTLSVGEKQEIEKPYVPSATIESDLNAIKEFNNEWYALILAEKDDQDIQDTADWIQSELKIFIAQSDSSDILNPASTMDIAYLLKNLQYDRTAIIYHAQPIENEKEFVDAAWLGKQLPTNPGSTNWMFKTLAGISPDKLTTTQSTAALAKNANTYETFGGNNMTRRGTMASGRYIDIRRGVDWLQTRMQERIFNLLINSPKIPFTGAGITLIENQVRKQLSDGVAIGLLSEIISVTVPKIEDISLSDKENRLLKGISFVAVLAGAIDKVEIRGNVTVSLSQ